YLEHVQERVREEHVIVGEPSALLATRNQNVGQRAPGAQRRHERPCRADRRLLVPRLAEHGCRACEGGDGKTIPGDDDLVISNRRRPTGTCLEQTVADLAQASGERSWLEAELTRDVFERARCRQDAAPLEVAGRSHPEPGRRAAGVVLAEPSAQLARCPGEE